ncbi:hypothetical protein QYE76_034345 [Lolium multiflorum]|uniref:Berberine/berberine-like domain-containing protein n=1 Tax=Lolium multiflorum TaxID=4521 RepID=A0AAD8QXX1_LOLMU|nr:hypothetical protein QYE76_034345 [Lolium multiflorum]
MIPSELVYGQSSSNFTDVLASSIKNPKFFTNTTVRPVCIVTPTNSWHVQAAVFCGRWHGVRLRVRSGGHDYEGLSYRSCQPEVFGVVDLSNLRSISVNQGDSTAWAYVNFRDLDIGQNTVGNENDVSSFESGQVWGERYFMGNYRRLAAVKAAVDPNDYFRNEQSIPPLRQQLETLL